LCLYGYRDITQTEQPVKTLWLVAFFGNFTQSLRVIWVEWIEFLDFRGHL
jgi:hypothetical protein